MGLELRLSNHLTSNHMFFKLLIKITKAYERNNFRLSSHLTYPGEYEPLGLYLRKWFSHLTNQFSLKPYLTR